MCRASKSAQNQLSKCMAIEFARRKQNIAVVMLHPGTVDTDLSQPFQKVCSERCCIAPGESLSGVALSIAMESCKDGFQSFAIPGRTAVSSSISL